MKNAVQKFLFSTILLCLVFSFTETTAAVPTHVKTSLDLPPVGGAWLKFAGKNGGSITQKEMQGQKNLSVDGCARGASIFQYTLVVTKGGKTSSYKGTSDALAAEMLTKLKSLATGDSFEFKEIKAYMKPNNEEITVRAEKFIVSATGV